LEALHDLRQFWFDQVTQTRLGAGHHNLMWLRVATVLNKHGMNDHTTDTGLRYFRDDCSPRSMNWTD
jgi:hypothetical protein